MIYKLRFEEDFEFVIVEANSISFATIQENGKNEAFGVTFSNFKYAVCYFTLIFHIFCTKIFCPCH
ncbi:hypothetical protein HanPI659440_Chr14g0567061 [Helianthus annuus]|nr:hypothetical protein HanIR_Chr14g0717251 [Helianthus annuus]KAJ0661188.1 hypothetical protein HanOQP8_Chr14g0545831 [Helianthus annuus]KAJ0704846.1 hypothetical protein HanPI659440_Chr14g0567061 [Helianthus annuus]